MECFPLLTLFLLFIFALFFLLHLDRASSEKQKLPPSPPKLPFIGNLHQLDTLVHRSCRELSEKYGPLMLLHLGCRPTLIVSSGEFAKKILHTHDMAFANRSVTSVGKALSYGCTDVLFSPYGEYLRKIKKIVAMELLNIKKVQSFKYVIEEEVASMINETNHFCSTGTQVNGSKMFTSFTYNVICRCVFGSKLQGKHPNAVELVKEGLKLSVAFSFRNFLPCLGWMDVLTGLDKRVKNVSNKVDVILDQVIDEHVAQDKDDHQKDFVDHLLHAQKDSFSDINFAHDNMKAVLLDMLVGGVESSSTTIEWAIAELMKNPTVMRKAQEEIRRVIGMKTKVDEDDIYQMEYLKAVIKETLRLHPPAALLLPRESNTAVNINNYHIPPNTRVVINAWAIQRDPKVWDKPEEFIPERFINNNTDFKGLHCEYIPFGAGRRICPGISFGVAMVEYALANLLYWFDWKCSGDADREEVDMSEAFGLSISKKNPLQLVPISHFSSSVLSYSSKSR